MADNSIRKSLKKYRLLLLVAIFLSLIHASIEGLGLGLLLPIIEGLSSPEAIKVESGLSAAIAGIFEFLNLPFTLWTLIVTGIILFLFQAILEYIRTLVTTRFVENIKNGIRVDFFSDLLNAEIRFFQNEKIGKLVNGLIVEANRAANSYLHLVNIVVHLAIVIVFLALAFTISWQLSTTTSVIAISLVYFTRQRKEIVKRGEDISISNSQIMTSSSEILSGIQEVKIFNLENILKDRFKTDAQRVSRNEWLLSKASSKLSLSYQIVAVLLLFLISGLGFFVLPITNAELGVFLAILFRLAPTARLLQTVRDKYLGTRPSIEVIDQLRAKIKQYSPAPLNLTSKTGELKIAEFRKSIDFTDVEFQYNQHDGNILSKINLSIPFGQTLAIVGPSGAGKTTMVDLIVKFYNPTKGEILIDGLDIREYDIESWRKQIGFVSQDPFLFNDTVYNNILYGNLEASEEDIQLSVATARVDEFIDRFPNGLQSKIGDRGVRLSGGQRQRIALARAILRNPPILILDEATQGLDAKSEHLISDALSEIGKERTIIMIAHQLSSVENANSIIFLEDGHLVESGTHKELLKKGGKYAEFHRLQIKREYE